MPSPLLNILLVSFEFPPHTHTGGIGSYMLHLANLLHEYGHNISVFSALPGGKNVEVNQTGSYTNYCIPAENNEEFKINAADFFETYRRDHVIDIMESPEVGACAINIKRNHPDILLVVKLHTPGVLINKVSRFYQPITQKLRFVAGALLRGRADAGYWSRKDKSRHTDDEYLITAMADTVLSPSQALKNRVVCFWGLSEKKIQVIPNPFSLSEELFDLPLNNRPKQISFVGKLSVLKGMIAFTKAIPAILDKNPGYKILLVGRDETENGKSMKEFMEIKLALHADRILFTGVISSSELKKVYADSRVCVFPSLWENYPTVVLEAMAAGAALAAADRGGIPEMVVHNSTGVLFDPLKPGEISEAVNFLIQHEDVRFKIIYNARKTLAERSGSTLFNENIVNVYLTLYSQGVCRK